MLKVLIGFLVGVAVVVGVVGRAPMGSIAPGAIGANPGCAQVGCVGTGQLEGQCEGGPSNQETGTGGVHGSSPICG